MESGCDGHSAEIASPGKLGLGNVFFFEAAAQRVLGNGADVVFPDSVLHQILIKIIEVLWPDLIQLDVADSFVNSREYGMIAVQCRRGQTIHGFQIQNVICVLRKGFIVIILITMLYFYREGMGGQPKNRNPFVWKVQETGIRSRPQRCRRGNL